MHQIRENMEIPPYKNSILAPALAAPGFSKYGPMTEVTSPVMASIIVARAMVLDRSFVDGVSQTTTIQGLAVRITSSEVM